VRTPGVAEGALAALRADLPGVAIRGSVTNFEGERLTVGSARTLRERLARAQNRKDG